MEWILFCLQRGHDYQLGLILKVETLKANPHRASSGASSVKVPLECIAKRQGERHNVTMVAMGPCRLTRRLTLGVFTPLISFQKDYRRKYCQRKQNLRKDLN